MRASTRSASPFLWLLALIPGDVLVAFDLRAGVVRPTAWAARFFPALVVLAFVAWAHLQRSALTLRLRRELGLVMPWALLLLSASGAALCADAAPPLARGILATLPATLSLALPMTVVLAPFLAERRDGTLAVVQLSPLSARVWGEKFALGAGLVVLSWLQLGPLLERGSELWWVALGGHALAVLTAPTWFFLTRDDGAAWGAALLTPLCLAAPLLTWFPLGSAGLLAAYGVAMLALLPRALRRGPASLLPRWLTRELPGVAWLERAVRPTWSAHLKAQRATLTLGAAGMLAAGLLLAAGQREAAPLTLFFFAAAAAVLSAALAFSEAGHLGVLEAQLVAQPRVRVFRERALVSAAITASIGVLSPAALLSFTGGFGLGGALAWGLGVALFWCVGLAAAVHLRSTGGALALGLGAAATLFLSQVALYVGSAWGTAYVAGRMLGSADGFLVAALVGGGLGAFALARRRFVAADRLEPVALLAATGGSLVHAAVLGVASVLAGVLVTS